MLKKLKISNYKSIERVDLDLGRVNVFIGENGAGKSNLLEAIALAGAADARKLDNEFLAARGVRVTDPRFMTSSFDSNQQNRPIQIELIDVEGVSARYSLTNDGKPYSSWQFDSLHNTFEQSHHAEKFTQSLFLALERLPEDSRADKAREIADALMGVLESIKSGTTPEPINIDLQFTEEDYKNFPSIDSHHKQFVIFSPENSALRTFAKEGQIEPLGINGEGLLKLLTVMAMDKSAGDIDRVNDALKMLKWFKSMKIVDIDTVPRMDIVDRFVDPKNGVFDQRSANEGFLFVTFFLCLLISPLTPRFFAIDNVDASLNPKLCEALMAQLVKLAVEGSKQVILTTHQPAILDGLDLNDDQQRLFVISRASNGRTKIKRFNKPIPQGYPRRMSELFLSGALGGLPKNF